MKLNKVLLPISLIYFLLTIVVISQSKHLNRLTNINTDKLILLENTAQIDKNDSYKIENNYSVTEGSPFNNNANSQIDSVVVKRENGDVNIYSYTYDSDGNINSATKVGGSRDSLVNIWRELSTYDANGNLITYLFQFGENDKWLNYAKGTYAYDSTGNRTSNLYRNWEDTVWVNNMQTQYFYNSHGDMTYYLSEDWDDSKWVNSFLKTNTYDSNYFLTSSLNQNWGENDWNGYTWIDSYTYDSNGNLVSVTKTRLVDTKWVNGTKRIYTYDKKEDKISALYLDWNENRWDTTGRNSYIYFNNKNIYMFLSEVLESGEWISYRKSTYFYYANGDLDFAKSDAWKNGYWAPSNGSMAIYDSEGNGSGYSGIEMKVYYPTTTYIKDKEKGVEGYLLSQNYPNPFNPSTVIKYEIGDAGFVSLKIYDILGQEIATLVNEPQNAGSYEMEFNTDSIKEKIISGVYFYRIETKGFTKTNKMLLIR